MWGNETQEQRSRRHEIQDQQWLATHVAQAAAEGRELQDCTICLAPIIPNQVRLPCGHGFHEGCWHEWSNACLDAGRRETCPYCRGEVGFPTHDQVREAIASHAPVADIRFMLQNECLADMDDDERAQLLEFAYAHGTPEVAEMLRRYISDRGYY